MSADLMPFDYNGQSVRTVVIDGEPWFVLADLCAVLGLGSPHKVADRIDPDARNQTPVIDSLGRSQTATIVNESGMYEVVIRSDKPEAVTFRRWLTGTVLPTIRKTGSFSVAPAIETPEMRMALGLQAAQQIIEQKDARIAELEGPADSWQHFASTDGDLSVNEVAKVLSRHPGIAIGETRLWKWLDAHRWTYRDAAGDRRAYQDRIESGHLTTRARSHHHPATGELVIDAPQVRVSMKGIELLRKHLATQLSVVAS